MAASITTPAAPDVRIRKARKQRKKRPVLALLSAGWLGLLVVLIIVRPVLGLPDPNTSDYMSIGVQPFTNGHILGTDLVGRDTLARLITGARVSLTVGVGSVIVAIIIGGPLGVVAGFLGSWTDRVIGAVVDILLAFPPLVATIALTVFLGASMTTLTLAIGVVFSPQIARVARTATLTFARRDFVAAARGTGASSWTILVREIVPNTIAPILAYATVMVAVGITAEAGISFLGLGVPPPQSSWGSMMGEDRSALSSNPHIVLIPAATMFITLLALNFLAEHIGRHFDIREAVL